jgi:hypothetical protein
MHNVFRFLKAKCLTFTVNKLQLSTIRLFFFFSRKEAKAFVLLRRRFGDPKLGEADPGGLGACPQENNWSKRSIRVRRRTIFTKRITNQRFRYADRFLWLQIQSQSFDEGGCVSVSLQQC